MVPASATISLRLLHVAKMSFGGRKCATTSEKDLRIVAGATATDFEWARAVIPAQGSANGAFASRQAHEDSAARTALLYLIMSVAAVPLS